MNPSLKIHIISDLHTDLLPYTPGTNQSDYTIIAGDITSNGEKGFKWLNKYHKNKKIIWVCGNHEYYGKAHPHLTVKLRKLARQTDNITFLEQDSLIVNNVCFLGCTLWPDFNLSGNSFKAKIIAMETMNDFRFIRSSPKFRKIHPADLVNWHHESLAWLKKELAKYHNFKRVVITHHAPSILSIPEAERNNLISASYASDLSGLIKKYQPEIWIHGHVHHASDYTIGKTRIICNPRGYPEETDIGFDKKFTIEI